MSAGDGLLSRSDEARYSPEQVCGLIEAMSDADLNAIWEASIYFGGRGGIEPEDLRQEALTRAIETRTCKVGIDIVPFICGIMKSLASEGPRAKKRARQKAQLRGTAPAPIGVELAFVDDYESLGGLKADAVSPEDEALSKIIHQRELEKVMTCISDDEDLLLLVEAIYDGMVGKALEDLLSTNTKGLAALRRKLGRRLAARFPDGTPT